MATATINREYALRICGIGLIMLALSAWSVYDGACGWPRQNQAMESVREEFAARSAGGMSPQDWLASPPDSPGLYPLKALFAEKGFSPPGKLVQELTAITEPQGDDRESRTARAERAIELFNEPLYPPAKLKGQFVQALVTLALALLAFSAVARKKGKVYSADEQGLSGSGFGDAAIPWGDVASVDWSRWEEKGIFRIALKDGRRFTLDGWHFAPMRPVAAIVRENT